MARIDKAKRALGGVIKRKRPSKAALKIVELELPRGKVLDFGCGYGFDASHFGWDGYDPYYGPELPDGKFDTVVCISVVNALSRNSRAKVLDEIKTKLKDDGKAYIAVPRDIPVTGKLGMHHSLQNYVVLTLPSIYLDDKLEIYELGPDSEFIDKTKDFMSLRDKRRSR